MGRGRADRCNMGDQETTRPSTGAIPLSSMNGAAPSMDGSDPPLDRPWRDERRLQKLFAWRRLSISELATRFGCSERTIENWVDRHDISRPWEHESTLRFLREERELSQREIAKRLGCTQGTISHRCEEFGIDSTRFIEDRPWHHEERLRELYVKKELSMEDVAARLGCEYQTGEKWVHHHGIETRPRNPHPPDVLQDEKELRTLYQQEKLSTYEIADKYECAPSTVHDWLDRHDIETRAVGSQPGEIHHRWKGGRDPYYGENWHETRRATLKRDGNSCQKCGMTQRVHQREHSFGLDVHHMEPLAEFETPEEANNLDNLITLCRSCHNTIEQRGDGR